MRFKRLICVIIPLLLCLGACDVAYADINGAYPVQIKGGGAGSFTWTADSANELPTKVTLFSQDLSAFLVSRDFNGTAEAFWVLPANQSILTPRGGFTKSGSTYTMTVHYAAATDSIQALAWTE